MRSICVIKFQKQTVIFNLFRIILNIIEYLMCLSVGFVYGLMDVVIHVLLFSFFAKPLKFIRKVLNIFWQLVN